jgi:hypothetical protein
MTIGAANATVPMGSGAAASQAMGRALALMRRPEPVPVAVGKAAVAATIRAVGAGAGAGPGSPGSRSNWRIESSDGDGRELAACGDALLRGATAQPVLENQEAQMSSMQARNLSLLHAAAKRGKAEHRRAYSRSRAVRSSLFRGSRQRRKQKSQLPAALGATRG